MGALDNAASWRYLAPELVLTMGVLALLVVDLVARRPDRRRAAALALVSLGGALVATALTAGDRRGLFHGLLARDPFTDFFKVLFAAVSGIVIVSSLRSRELVESREGPDRDRESGEAYALVLTATVGMNLLAAATDLLMAYLSLELVSLMSYVLAGFKRRDRASTEAALKYVIYGGVASGVMLYGMSLLYGMARATGFASIHAAAQHSPSLLMLVTAVVLVLAGFGYKIAAVPFHMWCPDVYEGAPTPIAAFFSVGPKAAGVALMIRFFEGAVPTQLAAAAGAAPWPVLLGAMAVATMTLGNLAALAQTNLKRMLAYSSIAHAGYLLLGLCAGNEAGQRAILLYLVTYLFMNLGAFLSVAALADAGLGETVAAYRGLGVRARLPALVLALCLFSLTGLPPLAGFFGKLYLFAALLEAGGTWRATLAVVAVVNSALSLYYYARVLKAMYFDAPPSDEPVRVAPLHLGLLGALGAATAGLWAVWSPLVDAAGAALAQWHPVATAIAHAP